MDLLKTTFKVTTLYTTTHQEVKMINTNDIKNIIIWLKIITATVVIICLTIILATFISLILSS